MNQENKAMIGDSLSGADLYVFQLLIRIDDLTRQKNMLEEKYNNLLTKLAENEQTRQD